MPNPEDKNEAVHEAAEKAAADLLAIAPVLEAHEYGPRDDGYVWNAWTRWGERALRELGEILRLTDQKREGTSDALPNKNEAVRRSEGELEAAVEALREYDQQMQRYGGLAAASYYGIARAVLTASQQPEDEDRSLYAEWRREAIRLREVLEQIRFLDPRDGVGDLTGSIWEAPIIARVALFGEERRGPIEMGAALLGPPVGPLPSQQPERPQPDEREWTLQRIAGTTTVLHRDGKGWRTGIGPGWTEALVVVPKSSYLAQRQRADRAEEASDAYQKERDWLEGRLSQAEAKVRELERGLKEISVRIEGRQHQGELTAIEKSLWQVAQQALARQALSPDPQGNR